MVNVIKLNQIEQVPNTYYNLIYKSKTSTYCYHLDNVISYDWTQSDTIKWCLRTFYGRYCSGKLTTLLQLQIENNLIKWIPLASLLKSHSLSSSSFWLQVFFVRALVFFLHFHFFLLSFFDLLLLVRRTFLMLHYF